jgi:hypothetical protein
MCLRVDATQSFYHDCARGPDGAACVRAPRRYASTVNTGTPG